VCRPPVRPDLAYIRTRRRRFEFIPESVELVLHPEVPGSISCELDEVLDALVLNAQRKIGMDRGTLGKLPPLVEYRFHCEVR
jgi:hypothetical protein